MGIVVKATEDRELRCALTPKERADKSERVAELLAKIDDAEASLRTAKARSKAETEALEAELDQALSAFRSGYELREVRCELQLDFELGQADWVRTDIGEVLVSRPIRPEERQQQLFAEERERDESEHLVDRGESEGDPELEAAAADSAAQDGTAAPAEPAPAKGRRQSRKSTETAAPAAL